MKPTVTVVNKATGEILEWSTTTDKEAAQAYIQIKELMGALERAKKKIKLAVLEKLDNSVDDTLDLGDLKWVKRVMHYRNYDLASLRKAVDADTFYDLVKPDKSKIDEIIKESVEATNPLINKEAAELLRSTMVEDRTPSVQVRLEKVPQ